MERKFHIKPNLKHLFFLLIGLFFLCVEPGFGIVEFNWKDLFRLFGNDGVKKNVPDQMEVFEDPYPSGTVVIDYEFFGSSLLVRKQDIRPSGKPDHMPFQEAIDHLNSVIGDGKILMEPPNLTQFLNSHIGLVKHGFSKNYKDAPPRRGGGIPMPFTVSGGDLENPGDRIYEAYSKDVKGWNVIQPISDIMGNLYALQHQACVNCKKCLDLSPSCPSCYSEEIGDIFGNPSTVFHHCYKHPCIDFSKAAEAAEKNHIKDNGFDHPFFGGSAIVFKLKVKDRTPPRIISLLPVPPGDGLPTLFADPTGPKANTGDFTKIDPLRVEDNYSDKITCQYAFTRQFDPSDPPKWELATGTGEVENGKEAAHVFLPNDGLGEMGYSLFAWDKDHNGNPGLTSVGENQPQICYGLSNLGFRELSWQDDFPLKFGPGPAIPDVLASDKFGKGKIIVDDNDWPNLMIQLVNKRDKGLPKSVLCFPPPVRDPSQRPPTIDTNPGSIAQLSQPGALIGYEDLQFATAAPYLKVLTAEGNNAPGDPGFSGFLADPIDPVFLKKNFRFEATDFSDTLPDGTPDKRPETMGQRMGFGNRMVVYCQENLIEDVEYEINVWAEDNVKWIHDPSGRVIHPPFTGIANLEVTVSDSTQRPPLLAKMDSRGETLSFWLPMPIRAVFREPVPTQLNRTSGETIWDKNFPFVEAKAWDFKGNQRSLKVYFNVTDELSRIRVLEQKHQKN
ncbi:MAG: hypothetical protein WA705_01130 [Candidatus Ozemobacteraceae bacterium]